MVDADEDAGETGRDGATAACAKAPTHAIDESHDIEQRSSPAGTSYSPHFEGSEQHEIIELSTVQYPNARHNQLATTTSTPFVPQIETSNNASPSTVSQRNVPPALVHPLSTIFPENVWPGKDLIDSIDPSACQPFQRPNGSSFSGGNIFAALRQRGLVAPSDGNALRQHKAVDMLRWEINRESSLNDGDLEEAAKRNNPATDIDTRVERKKDLYVRDKERLEEGVIPMRARPKKRRVEKADGIRVSKVTKKKKAKVDKADRYREKVDKVDGSHEKDVPESGQNNIDIDAQLAGDG